MILSIDLGSTSFKAGIFDRDLRPLSEEGHALAYQSNRYSDATLPAVEVENGFRNCIAAAIKSAGMDAGKIIAVAITGQAQTFCLTNRRKQPLTPFISWQDTTSRSTINQPSLFPLRMKFKEHCAFTDLSPGLQIASFLHWQESGLLPSVPFCLMPLHSYLIFLLSGQFVTDDNMAAMTGFYSLPRHDWWTEALHICRLTPEQLPQLIPAGCEAAKTGADNLFGLPPGLPVYSAGNDQTAGAFGASIAATDVYLSLGTAYVAYGIFPALPEVKPETALGIYYGQRYYRLAIAKHGGDALRQLAEQFADGDFDRLFQPQVPDGKLQSALNEIIADLAETVNRLEISKPRRLLVGGGGNRFPCLLQQLEQAVGLQVIKSASGPLSGAAMTALKMV